MASKYWHVTRDLFALQTDYVEFVWCIEYISLKLSMRTRLLSQFAGRSLKQAAPFYFSHKYTQHPPIQSPKVSSYEKLRLLEQIDQQTNLEVLKREIANDTIQLPLKFFAYYSAPLQNQGTFFAEFIRSCIDATNHIILYGASMVDLSPSRRYPYGIEKVKNMVVLIPGMLFLYCGCEIQYEQIHSIYNGVKLVTDTHGSQTSLILYLLSIGVELSIIKKNIKSALSTDQVSQKERRSLLDTFKAVFSKKDPVLQAVLFENAITLSSTLVPMMSALLTVFFPNPWYEVVGSMMIGGVQIYLGIHLMKKNLVKLMGEESLDKLEMARIDQIIQSNPFVQQVSNQRAVMIGQRKFRYAAEITFDNNKITREIMEDFYEKMERIVYTESHADREAYLKSLMETLTNRLLAKLHQEIDKISNSIKEEFPNCMHDDLEINHSSLAESYIEEELENNLFYTTQDTEQEIPFEKWMLEAADQIIQYFVLKDKKSMHESHLTYNDYCRSREYSTLTDDEENEELFLNEDFKFHELQKELEESKN